ncbi:unnamed protein product [Rotaria sp. Silwood1]|nr:unnamed protein product [Rotaria sp. Silwood1]CAF3574305.1 unnamed protein product [Rotaria sp. Silwood1]CAF3591810.1 unnamed protein product [Rotaria sp. Silwood1]CAF3635654.1 unnamed protein product [Rotaria sp. Silwood1]CAF4765489.1 unnamed protein product [Rotaria sp. Silwood1]
MKLVLRLSPRRCPYSSKNTNAFFQTNSLIKTINTITASNQNANESMEHLGNELIVQNNASQCQSQQPSSLQDQETKQILDDVHYVSYNGELLWRVEDFARKFAEAESRKHPSIVSPVFYSSPNGYKMRASLFLNGDGDVEGTHMSIYLVLYKGDYDAIVWWPFTIPVVFCLFDQTGQGLHIIDRFYPDATSSSSQKPTSEKNIASGVQKFCQLVVIKTKENCYVRDDTMFIKIMLDFGKTPRQILPYTLSLNPGLPEHIQEAMRCMEIEKYEQARKALMAKVVQEDQEILRCSLIPVNRSAVQVTAQQQLTSTTNSEDGISCEDIANE